MNVVATKVSQLYQKCLSVLYNQLPFQAGSTQRCVHEWVKITSDSFILNAVSNCHIVFHHEPNQQINTTRPHSSLSLVEQQIIDNKIAKFLAKGIIRSTVSEPGDIVSPIFVTLKKDGSHRVIFNLKKLNDSVSYHHFKLDTLKTAIQLIKPFCYMSSIDLNDAYYSLHIAIEHQKYLKFFWKYVLYTFTCLPMGLSSSPRIFTKVMKPIFSNLRSTFGHICLSYIDDSLYIHVGNTATECA